MAVLRDAGERMTDVEAYVEIATAGVPGVVPAGQDGRRRLTFGAWDQAADGVASLLAGHGVGKGDVVCLSLPSSIDYAVCYQAAARLGAVTSGVNLRLGVGERDSVFARSRPKVTVVNSAALGSAALPSDAGHPIGRDELANSAGRKAPRLPALAADDPVCIVWTSGSTGRPKGALFDHRNLAAVAAGSDVLSQPGDRRLSPLPFAHVGYMTRAWDEISHGITTVVTPQPWSAAEAIALLSSERVTVGQGVPTQWALVLRHPDLEGADLASLRIAATGAARVPAELVREMRRRLSCPVVVRYTSTESSLGSGTRPGDPDDVVCTTVGRPVPGVELSVVDEAGYEVPPGDVGRVRLRSEAVMRGYVAHGTVIDSDATASVLDEAGWLTTGDLGWLDGEGNLHLAGRQTEMYIRGGYNVYPAEVEAVLRRHVSVMDVAVVGLDDPVLGEIGAAFVVPAPATPAAPGLEELRAWCRRELADYKAPDRLIVLDALPLTAMGKVDTKALQTGMAVPTARGAS